MAEKTQKKTQKIQNKTENKSEKKSKNIYMITTYILLAVIVIVGANYMVSDMSRKAHSSGIAEGQTQTVDFILANIMQTGSVEIRVSENTSVVLVPYQSVQAAYEDTLLRVAQAAIEDGSVTITNNNQSLTLIPYTPQMANPSQ